MTQSNHRTMKRRILVSSLLAIFLLTSGAAAASALLQTVEETRAVGSAGFTSASVGSVTLNATLGQPFVGVNSNGNVDLSHGFWHGVVDNTIYLPVIKR
jgi:hypothetical protein